VSSISVLPYDRNTAELRSLLGEPAFQAAVHRAESPERKKDEGVAPLHFVGGEKRFCQVLFTCWFATC